MCFSEPSSCPPLQRKALLTTGTHRERNTPHAVRAHRAVGVGVLHVCSCVLYDRHVCVKVMCENIVTMQSSIKQVNIYL